MCKRHGGRSQIERRLHLRDVAKEEPEEEGEDGPGALGVEAVRITHATKSKAHQNL